MVHALSTEVRAWIEYEALDLPLTFWRTSSGFEVDLIVGDLDAAIECKSGREVRAADLKGIRALREEHRPRRSLGVSRVNEPRRTDDGIEIVPWSEFLSELWSGGITG